MYNCMQLIMLALSRYSVQPPYLSVKVVTYCILPLKNRFFFKRIHLETNMGTVFCLHFLLQRPKASKQMMKVRE